MGGGAKVPLEMLALQGVSVAKRFYEFLIQTLYHFKKRKKEKNESLLQIY
jgi:hypothetical protein